MTRRPGAGTPFAPRYRRPACCWAATRLLLLLFAFNTLPYFSRGAIIGDVDIYQGWAWIMSHQGTFPFHDPQWQYPPGAALIMLAPLLISWTGVGYVNAFIAIAFLADAAVFTLLVGQTDRIAREGGAEPHRTGLWAWILGGFVLGPIIYMRYDVIVTAVAVGGMCAAARAVERHRGGDEVGDGGVEAGERAGKRSWNVAGGLIGLGAIIKAWPAVLLLGLPNGRRGARALTAAGISALVVALGLIAAMPGGLSFLTGQSDRGIEVESVLASPFMILSWCGLDVRTVHQFGNFQLSGPGTGVVASLAIVLTVVGFGVVLWWRLRRFDTARWTPALMHDVGLTVVLVLIVTSRVLSPQYLIWLTGLAALCLTETGPTRRGTLMARPARMVMACVLISQVEFPLLFGEVMNGGVGGTLLVAARNGVLVAATVIALRTLWNAATRPEPTGARDDAARCEAAVQEAVEGSASPAGALTQAAAPGTLSQTGGRS